MSPTTRREGPPARLIDITRLASRAGRTLTGVDRVERAYLVELLGQPTPLFALARTALGYLLLDRAGAEGFLRRLDAGDWAPPDMLSRLARGKTPAQRAAEAALRRLSIARVRRGRLARMLGNRLPPGTAYLNLGHTNLTARVVAAVRTVPGARIAVFIHDTIPLDLPQMQREGSVDRFAGLLARAGEADVILTSSAAVAADIRRHLPEGPPIAHAPLGVAPAAPDPAALPKGLPPARPYFVALGTIEPRKNIGLLLDTWEALGEDPPPLLLCGSRGWKNRAVFARLDAGVPGVRECPGLSDGAVSALVADARALLFPSLAEGFGLPPAEAAALGTPVVCGDLAICREVLGDVPVYVDVSDSYAWEKTIRQLSEQPFPAPAPGFTPPDWADHFKVVSSVT
ncbi:glycosyltransferase family 4 protein [Roseisalinus antarcticus]|uniref:Glycosyl transferases group 1 n=1 Tax=Roseisalinus antarcticus TaxID=254357 RepID=A0A1Y5S5Q3_9RHOB|nr:glycosyltransferase family 1 protein [Roseisalinus antarcticus]SLN33057.1 Glycosyl transferases group 1 [Roseisalinus antarcticus]